MDVKFKKSQSSFKSFYTPEDTFCPKAWFMAYVLRERNEDTPTHAQLCGQVFEYKCIGATVSGNIPRLDQVNIKNLKPAKNAKKDDLLAYLDSKKELVSEPYDEKMTNPNLYALIDQLPDDYDEGEPGADERAIDEMVALFREYEEKMGIQTIDVQYYLDNGEWNGAADRTAIQKITPDKVEIRDLKYASTAFDREYYNGWSQPAEEAYNRFRRRANGKSYKDEGYLYGFITADSLTERIAYIEGLTFYEKSIIQAVHYCIIFHDMHGVWPDFYFDIYGKSGWQRVRQIILDPEFETVRHHYIAMDIFDDDLAYYWEHGFDYDPKYPACRSCRYAETCPEFVKFPEVEQTYLNDQVKDRNSVRVG